MYCTLGGKHCDALGTVGWVFTTGTRPHVQPFEMDAREAKTLIDAGGPVDLVIEDNKFLSVTGLYVVGEGPASRDKFRTVLVADLRWKWSRKLITGRYNMRRRTGQKHLVAAAGIVQLGQVIDNFMFMPASLKGETTKWKPREVVEDVLKKLSDGNDFEFDFDIDIDTDALEVNDCYINDQGPEALEIALTHLPGTTVWVDQYAKVHVQSSIGLKEAKIIEAMGPDVVEQGHVSKVSYKDVRPSKIKVYFVREQEVRHDSSDGTEQSADARVMTNVAMITDPEISIGGQLMMYGSWASFDSLFTPWNASLPDVDDGIPVPPPVSHTIIQQAFFEDALFRIYVPFGDDVPQPLWSGRINSIKTHYRQTWQLNRRWVDRSSQIKAVRCAIIDFTTGTRGRTQCYGDYCVKVAALPTQLKLNKGQLWKNVYGGPNDSAFGAGTDLGDAEVTPAIVSLLDDEAGIVHFDYLVDPFGCWKQIYPSAVDNLPSAVMNDSKPRGVNMRVGENGAFPKLTSSHHCAVVLTHVPSMPNSNGQFYCVEVSPDDVKGLVKGLEITPCNGPVWEVFIDPGVVTARIAWLDAYKATIERSFGVGLTNGDPNVAVEDARILKDLLVNGEDLDAVAKAKAAEIWSKLTDRYIGSKAVRMDPGVKIAGSIDSVEHFVDIDGAVLTRVSLPEELQSRNYFALLPPGTRRIVFREVAP